MFIMAASNSAHRSPCTGPCNMLRRRRTDLELKQLRALAAIAETGSFVEAAQPLNLTQSALSHQIRHLEEELGETLLVRGKPRVVPSASGRAVLQSARTVLAEVDSIRGMFGSADPGEMTGTITVAATS